MSQIGRREYAKLYGPTTGDQVRLGDTDLWIEIEQDFCVGGDEAVFGGGKSIRESGAQGMTTRAEGALDLVITNVIVLDHWGVVRGDVGIRDGRIVAVGKSGNPDVMDGVHPDLKIGPTTDVIAGDRKILTAGAIDTHVHFLTEIEMAEALATGEGRDGHARTSDGKVDLDLSIPKEMGGSGVGTNPEQLFAAGYAACFHSALRMVAGQDKADVTDSTVGARVSIGSLDNGGFGLAVELEVALPNLDHETAQKLADKAHEVCPYSNATRGNIDVNVVVTDD